MAESGWTPVSLCDHKQTQTEMLSNFNYYYYLNYYFNTKILLVFIKQVIMIIVIMIVNAI